MARAETELNLSGSDGDILDSFALSTARGDTVDLTELGFTLPFEFLIQESPEISQNWPDQSWAAIPEDERIADVVAKLNVAVEHGINSILERAIPGINRDIPRMKKIAQQTSLNILVMTGWYTFHSLEYFFQLREEFPHLFKGLPSLADLMVRDIEEGIADTGVRASGIKLVSDRYGIHEPGNLRAVWKHAADAHRRTGAPIITHSTGVGSLVIQQEVFAEDGVDLSRIVLGHADRTPSNVPLGEFERLLQRGSFVLFDGWMEGESLDDIPVALPALPATIDENLDRIARLIELGYEKQLLISSGTIIFTDCLPGLSQSFPPLARIQIDLIPRLKERGVSEAQIEQLTVGNPRRMLESLARGGY